MPGQLCTKVAIDSRQSSRRNQTLLLRLLSGGKTRDIEIAAFMRQLASAGHKELNSEVCHQVVEFVIQETRNHDRRLDLRHMRKAFEDRRQFEHGHSQTSWQDLVRTSLSKSLTQSAGATNARQLKAVESAIRKYPDDWRKQVEDSGMSKTTFYKFRSQLELSS